MTKATRRAAFDALAEVQGAVRGSMTQREARAIGVAASEILRATPDVTREEILARADRYLAHFPGAALTANALAKYWSQCSQAPARTKGPIDRAAQIVEQAWEEERREAHGGEGPAGSVAGLLPPASTP